MSTTTGIQALPWRAPRRDVTARHVARLVRITPALLETAVVLGAAAAAVAMTESGVLGVVMLPSSAYLVFSVAAAAGAASASVVAGFAARIARSASYSRVAAVMGVYGLVVVPSMVAGLAADADTVALRLAGAFAGTACAGLLAFTALVRDGATNGRGGWLLIGALLATAAGVAGVVDAFGAAEPATVLSAQRCAVLAWGLAAVTLLAAGALSRRPLQWRLGLGAAALTGAHALAATPVAAQATTTLFALLQLLGVATLLVATPTVPAGRDHRGPVSARGRVPFAGGGPARARRDQRTHRRTRPRAAQRPDRIVRGRVAGQLRARPGTRRAAGDLAGRDRRAGPAS